MAPSRSTALSCTQLDELHPCWQYPHGTNSHVAQAPVGGGVGASLVVGTTDGALLGQGVGESGRQFDG